MNITYLVDLENIGLAALCRHANEHKDNEYIIFYSENTPDPGHILEHLPDMARVKFTDCKSGGHNAMDFCICVAAGKMSVYQTSKVRILSNDKGYDSMIHMLQEDGVRIAREKTGSEKEPAAEKTDSHIKQDDKRRLMAAIRKAAPKKYQDLLMHRIPNAENRKEAYEMCQTVLPQNIAADVYRKLRKHIPKGDL